MSFNGSGTFVINSTGQPVVTGTTVSSTVFNAFTADVGSGLSNTICKDGQSTPTANIPLGGFKLTGLGLATSRSDAASLANVQDGTGVYVSTVGGTADAITLSPSPVISAYTAGQEFCFIASGANTGAVTVNVNSLGAKAVTRTGSTALVAGDIASGALIGIRYDGTRFQIISYTSLPSSGGSVTGNLSVGGTLGVTGATTLSSTLGVTGATTLSSTLGVTGAATLNSNLSVGGTLGVTGAATFSSDTAVSRSSAGGTVILYSENTNNANAASDAVMQVNVGGASGGDPKLILNVSGVTSWSVGSDNSDSDTFKVGPSYTVGSGTLFAITTGGSITTGGATAATGYTNSGDITLPASGAIRAANTIKARGYVTNNGTATLVAGFNVTSVTRNGAGDLTITMTNALADANYSVVGCAKSAADASNAVLMQLSSAASKTTTTFRVRTFGTSSGYMDIDFDFMVVG